MCKHGKLIQIYHNIMYVTYLLAPDMAPLVEIFDSIQGGEGPDVVSAYEDAACGEVEKASIISLC